MVVQLLLSDGQSLPLSRLPEEVQLNLTRELGTLRIIDRETLHAVAEEFARDIEAIGLTAPNGMAGALAALAGQLSPGATARLRVEAAQAQDVDPWPQVIDLGQDVLLALLAQESTEVAAIVLSKLPVARAAELLGRLPGERARRITHAVSQTADILPAAVARIGRGLATEYCARAEPAFAHPPVQRLGAILNSSAPATRDALLEGLGHADPALADQVRRAIFTFADILDRLAPLDVPKVLRGVDSAVLVTAFAAAQAQGGPDAAAADFLLANMSQRMAENLREEIKERGRVKRAEAEAAMARIVGAIRERADAGEVTLIVAEEAEGQPLP
jgi:flagellar motor switch protein FliG